GVLAVDGDADGACRQVARVQGHGAAERAVVDGAGRGDVGVRRRGAAEDVEGARRDGGRLVEGTARAVLEHRAADGEHGAVLGDLLAVLVGRGRRQGGDDTRAVVVEGEGV